MTITLAILRTLAKSAPYLSPIEPLAMDVRAIATGRPEYTAVKTELRTLESNGWVVSVPHPETGLSYRITPAGEAELARRES